MSGTVTCQSCGKSVAKDSQFCPWCGMKVVHPVDTVAVFPQGNRLGFGRDDGDLIGPNRVGDGHWSSAAGAQAVAPFGSG